RAARADAATGLLDIRRLGEALSRIRGRIIHKDLDRVSPLAVPVMLEIGRETVYGEASDELLREAADALVEEAMGWIFRRVTPAGRTTRRPMLRRSTTWRWRGFRSCSIQLARSTGRRNAPSSWPICIWKRARASRAAASCCRPSTPPRRWNGSHR